MFPCTICFKEYPSLYDAARCIVTHKTNEVIMLQDNDDKCELCGGYRSSLTSRNVLGHKFCSTCGDNIVIPRATVVFNVLMEQLRDEQRHKLVAQTDNIGM